LGAAGVTEEAARVGGHHRADPVWRKGMDCHVIQSGEIVWCLI
jgi:hypothetical protein